MGRKKGNPKEPQSVEEFIRTAPRNMLACRALMHAWDANKGAVKTEGGRYFWSTPCMRCGTVKVREISARGNLVSTAYRYPEGYQIHVGGKMDKTDLADIRLVVIKEYV